MDLQGTVVVDQRPVPNAVVLASDEGRPLGVATADAAGRFTLTALPDSGAVTIRAVEPTAGAGTVVVQLPSPDPVTVAVSLRDCQLYLDVPDPRWLVTTAFLTSWDAEPLAQACADCPVYRWFWERPGAAPVALRLDFTDDGLISTARVRTATGWDQATRTLSVRRAKRVDAALGLSGFWQLEHLTTGQGCFPEASQWTMEAIASPGYRALYRVLPYGTPVAFLGRQWVRAAGLKVKRKAFAE